MSDNIQTNGHYEDTFLQTLHPGVMKSTLFSAMMLAYWDNVMGPVISKVWLGNEKVHINEEIVNYISTHTLSGELCRQTEKHTIDPKLYVLADLGCIFCSFIFNGRSKMGPTISSLSFIMAYTEMDRYLLLQDLISRQVKLLVLKYRVLQQKDMDTAVKLFATHLKTFSKTIDIIEGSDLHENICVDKTIFGEFNQASDSNLLDAKFLMRSITSHLQTCGCTIVCGKSEGRINMLIKTLLLFLSANERCCSLYASADENSVWIQDLFVQGLMKKDDNISFHTSICCKSVLLGTYPVSLIDVDKKTVHQTPHLSKHGVARKEFLKILLGLLLKGIELPDCPYMKIADLLREHGCPIPENLFTEDFGDMSVMVQRFVTELIALPNKCSIKKNHISNFMAILNQKAMALLSYVESSSLSGKVTLDDSQIQQMKQDLLFTSEADFRIILACAEKIQPGIAIFLEGDFHKEHVKVIRILEAI